MNVDSIRKVFTAQGYAHTRDTKKRDEYQAPITGHYLYFSKGRDLTSSLQIVIHPHLKFEPFLDLPGVSCPKPDEFHHGSNMRQFPKRKNRGEEEIHYGRALKIDSPDALARFLQFFDTSAGSQRENDDLPPRLTAIELENFKGVGERVRIELAPITLLFGANSAGKSTILQALHYMREILERRNTNPDRTLYGGDFIDLGGFLNLVHHRDLSRRIGIKLELALNSKNLPDLMPEPWEGWQAGQTFNEEGIWEFYNLLQETRDRTETVSIRLEIAWSAMRQTAVVGVYEASVNGDWLSRIEASEDGQDVSIRINKDNPIFLRYRTQEEIDVFASIDDWIKQEDLQKARTSDDTTQATEEAGKDYTDSVLGEILAIIREAGADQPGQGLRQWLTGFDSALPHLGELLKIPVSATGGSANIYITREFTAFLSSLIIGPGVLIRDQLRKLRYLGPIRNVPDRNFSAALTPDEARWADGTAAWEALLTGDLALIEKVSEWMSDKEKLATGYEIERRGFKEIDVGTLNWLICAANPDAGIRSDPDLLRQLEMMPEKWRLDLIEAKTGMKVQPGDVGIGISQVLPVVVAALEPSASLVAIEQPELHIHPAVQVGLGDLLITGAKEQGISFLIETHSEHLILRLLRRIRETTEGELPPEGIPLRSRDVAVVYIQSGGTGAEVVSLPIDETGEFTKRWPKGFFDERAEELF
jgi:predicted ATPase